MQMISNSYNKTNKTFRRNLDFSNIKEQSVFAIDYFHSSNFSNKVTCNKTNEKIINNHLLNTPLIINQSNNYNTINEYSEEELYLSKLNLECDIYISSLKQNLVNIKKDRKQIETKIINLKKKIQELQDKEMKSSKQLEHTRNYINRIMKNSKNNLNKNYGIIITKINNIYQNNKNPGNIKLNINNSNNYKTVVPTKKSVSSMVETNLSHLPFYNEIKNIDINNNISNREIRLKRNLIKNQKIKKAEFATDIKNCPSPITSKIYIKKNITSIRKTKNYENIKNNLIKNIKKDIDEKLRIEREIEKVNKEQNKLYNNFYENFVILRSAKTLDVD
jgi:hypothetical protein